MNFLNNETLTELAEYIHNEAYKKFIDNKTTIFLCGASRDMINSTRFKIEELLLRKFYYQLKYQIVYPEDLFTDLLLGHGRHDLISLENVLADSVDAIVIIVESWGAVAELGMFSSNEGLRKKIVCIIDKKYKKSKSFIQLGPVRLMRDKKEGVVLYEDFTNLDPEIKRIHQAIHSISKTTQKSSGVINALQAHVFVLPCIYLLEPVNDKLIKELVRHSANIDDNLAMALSRTALSMLINRREIRLASDGYRLTELGLAKFKNLSRTGKNKYAYDIHEMDEIRLRILNWRLRNKGLIFQNN